MLPGLRQKAAGPETGVIDAFPDPGTYHLDHGPDDVPLGVELPGVPWRIGGDTLEKILVQLGQDDDVGPVGEVQAVDLLHHSGEARAAPRVVADRREDSAELLAHQVGGELAGPVRATEVAQVRPQLAVDEPKHLVGPIGSARPRSPAKLPVQAAPVHLVAELRLLLALILDLVERLEEEQPRELFHVIPRSHSVGVELVAGVLHRLLDLLTPVLDTVVGRCSHSPDSSLRDPLLQEDHFRATLQSGPRAHLGPRVSRPHFRLFGQVEVR